MGMSTYVVGVKPADAKWKQMKAVYDACESAKLPVPREVEKFFNDDKPDPDGVTIDGRALMECGAVEYVEPNHPESGYSINIKKLPPDVTIVRVINSW